MKRYKYIGRFRSDTGHEYSLEVNCDGTIQAFILLTAKAIESARHYQLRDITDENGNVTKVGDILKVVELFN